MKTCCGWHSCRVRKSGSALPACIHLPRQGLVHVFAGVGVACNAAGVNSSPLSLAHAGPSERQQLEQLCVAGCSCQSCCMCAAPGRAAAPCEPGQDEEASTLRFTTFTRVNFLDKTVQITQGGVSAGDLSSCAHIGVHGAPQIASTGLLGLTHWAWPSSPS